MFDELDKSTGLIGTVEYGIDEFLMNEDGDMWKRDEPDPTLQRYVQLGSRRDCCLIAHTSAGFSLVH